MPRNVRNFWMEADIDGYASTLVGGPKNKMGGMNINLFARDNGCLKKIANISCFADGMGNLKTTIHLIDDGEMLEAKTIR